MLGMMIHCFGEDLQDAGLDCTSIRSGYFLGSPIIQDRRARGKWGKTD